MIVTFKFLSTLEIISMNINPPKVETFVIFCNPKDQNTTPASWNLLKIAAYNQEW